MNKSSANSYSSEWFNQFHLTIPADRTEREVRFITSVMPLHSHSKILDVCSGDGRHSRALARQGYAVTAVERDARMIQIARAQSKGPAFIETDLRAYQPSPGSFAGIIIMCQSFGYYESATNQDVLNRLGSALQPGGRMILDMWNPDFFHEHAGERMIESASGPIREWTQMQGDRLLSRVDYPNGSHDEFDFQTFTYEALRDFAAKVSLRIRHACSRYDLESPPAPNVPKAQYVLELSRNEVGNTDPDFNRRHRLREIAGKLGTFEGFLTPAKLAEKREKEMVR